MAASNGDQAPDEYYPSMLIKPVLPTNDAASIRRVNHGDDHSWTV